MSLQLGLVNNVMHNLRLQTEVYSLELVAWSKTTEGKEYNVSVKVIEQQYEAYLESVPSFTLFLACKLQS